MFKLLVFILIIVFLFQILKAVQLRSKGGEPQAGEEGLGRRQVGFDRSQVIDAEFKEVEEDAEAEK